MTVGTQAAVLAGLDITMFIEFTPPSNSVWGEELAFIPRTLKFIYYIMIISAFCANMTVVSHTTALSVLGAGLALRGPDGSMVTATDGLYEERRAVFFTFGTGLACTVGSLIMCVWLVLHWEAALVCFGITTYTAYKIAQNYRRVHRRFEYDESETVNFDDIFYGPAAIQVVRSGIRTLTDKLTGSPRHQHKDTTYVSNGIDHGAPFMPDMNGGSVSKRRNGGSNVHVV